MDLIWLKVLRNSCTVLYLFYSGFRPKQSGGAHAHLSPACSNYCSEQIDELLLDPCCALKYYPSIEECVRVSQNIF